MTEHNDFSITCSPDNKDLIKTLERITKENNMNETKVKKMDIKEFRDKGFLQEANRLFFHPLGLALEVKNVNTDKECLGGIWDYRDDPEGMLFAKETMSSEEAIDKYQSVCSLKDSKTKARVATGECHANGVQFLGNKVTDMCPPPLPDPPKVEFYKESGIKPEKETG